MTSSSNQPIDPGGSFQRALAYETERIREAYAEYLTLPSLLDFLRHKNGWPVRFHPFPRIDRAKWVWKDWTKSRVPMAWEVLRGRHECGY